MNVQGHRGARGLRPESTMQAFEVALDLMVDTLELDLHLTADDQVVIWHDEALWAEKGSLLPGAPAHMELPAPMRSLAVADLAFFNANLNPDPERFDAQLADSTELAGDDFRIGTLTRLFDFVEQYAASEMKSEAQRANAAAMQFNIETKRVEANPEFIGDDFDGVNVGVFEQVLLDTIDAAGVMERCVIQSFDFRSLRAIAAVRPDVQLSALSEFVPDMAELASDGVSIWSPYYLIVSSENVADAHANRLQVLPWTVNETEAMQSIIDMGVDGFITDRPDLGITFSGRNQ